MTAIPARHGPQLSQPIVGEVVGFLLRCAGTTVLVTGDTVLHRGLRRAVRDVQVDVMIVHVGGVRFRLTGPIRYTLTGAQVVNLVRVGGPRVAVPVHYEGWVDALRRRSRRPGAGARRRPGGRPGPDPSAADRHVYGALRP